VVESERGRALFASYPAHATVIGPSGRFLSADYPGGFARALEGKDFDVVLFAAGPVGSQAPGPPPVADEWERADAMGRALAAAARPALARIALDPAPALGGGAIEMTLPPLALRLAPDYRLSPLLAETQTDRRAFLHAFRIADEVLIGLPGELSGELGLDLERRVRASARRHAWPLPFNGDYTGYVLPDESYPRWHYENRMSLFGPHLGSYLIDVAAAAAGERR
jgi:hypothetical protein